VLASAANLTSYPILLLIACALAILTATFVKWATGAHPGTRVAAPEQ